MGNKSNNASLNRSEMTNTTPTKRREFQSAMHSHQYDVNSHGLLNSKSDKSDQINARDDVIR